MANNSAAPLQPHSQAFFFYTPQWTIIVESMFIDTLQIERNRLGRPLTTRDTIPIRTARNGVNAVFNKSFTNRECMNQFKKPQCRHGVFNFIICLSSVYYDETDNVVHAFEDFVWDYVVLKYKLGEAYMLKGEPAWNELCKIFGLAPSLSPATRVKMIDLTGTDPDDSIPIPQVPSNTSAQSPVPLSYGMYVPSNVMRLPREVLSGNTSNGSPSFWTDVIRQGYPAWGERLLSNTSEKSDVNVPLEPAKGPMKSHNLFGRVEKADKLLLGQGKKPPALQPSKSVTCSQGSSSTVNGPMKGKSKLIGFMKHVGATSSAFD